MCMGPWTTFRTFVGGPLGSNIPTQDCESLIKAKIVIELKILMPFFNTSSAFGFKTTGLEGFCVWVHGSMDPIQYPWGRHLGLHLPLKDCESPIKAKTELMKI